MHFLRLARPVSCWVYGSIVIDNRHVTYFLTNERLSHFMAMHTWNSGGQQIIARFNLVAFVLICVIPLCFLLRDKE